MTPTRARQMAFVLKIGLALMFSWAGLAKLGDPWQFSTEISNYNLLPQLAGPLAAALPALEIAIALVLLASPIGSPWLTAASALATGMLAAFTVAVAQVVVRKIDVSCGCFGKGSGAVSWTTVGRDLVFLAASGWLLWLSRPSVTTRRAP